MDLIECDETLIGDVLSAGILVHRELGPGLLESVYEQALLIELVDRGFKARHQVKVPVEYKGRDLGHGFRADLVVEESLLIEIKSVSVLNEVHLAQVMTYLRLLRFKPGLLLNFNQRLLRHGIRRVSI